MFDRFKKKKSQPVAKKSQKVAMPSADASVKAVYIMTFTAEPMPAEALKPAVKAAEGMLKGKNPVFAQLWTEQMKPESKIEVANVQYAGPMMHTPQTMQTTLAGWIKKQYNADYQPIVNKNFFPHGMRDGQGRENFFLFYFEMEE
jgi:hypothetical protein